MARERKLFGDKTGNMSKWAKQGLGVVLGAGLAMGSYVTAKNVFDTNYEFQTQPNVEQILQHDPVADIQKKFSEIELPRANTQPESNTYNSQSENEPSVQQNYKPQEPTLDCTLEGDWTWTPELANCENITMDVNMLPGHGLEYTLKNKHNVPEPVVTSNIEEMQDSLLANGQLDEIRDTLFVDYSGDKGEWKISSEDCGDGLNDAWSATKTYTPSFSPNSQFSITKEANDAKDAVPCNDCDEPTPEMTAVPEPIPEPKEALEEEQLVRTPAELREADLYCLAENLEHNNEFPHTYTKGSALRSDAKDMGLEAAVGQLSNDWVVYFPTNQGFAFMPNQLSGDVMTTYFDFDGDGMLENKLTSNIDYDNGQPDKKDTFRSVLRNLHEASPMSDVEISANQNRFADAIANIRNDSDFANCEYVIEEAPEHEPVVQEEPEVVVREEPAERVVYETVRPTTEVRRGHRHNHYCNHNVGHAPVRRGFHFNASYSKIKVRGHGPAPQFRGRHGFRGGHQGYQRRPVQPFLDFRGSIRHGGPSPSDNLNRRLNHYKGW